METCVVFQIATGAPIDLTILAKSGRLLFVIRRAEPGNRTGESGSQNHGEHPMSPPLDRQSYTVPEIVSMSSLREQTVCRMFRASPSSCISRERLIVADAVEKLIP